MDQITSLTKFRNPYGNQEIEIQQVEYEAGGIPMLRLRIRERGARFTIFDLDPVTARFWAEEMLRWAGPLAERYHGAQSAPDSVATPDSAEE